MRVIITIMTVWIMVLLLPTVPFKKIIAQLQEKLQILST